MSGTKMGWVHCKPWAPSERKEGGEVNRRGERGVQRGRVWGGVDWSDWRSERWTKMDELWRGIDCGEE